jgi:hypothetical protein
LFPPTEGAKAISRNHTDKHQSNKNLGGKVGELLVPLQCLGDRLPESQPGKLVQDSDAMVLELLQENTKQFQSPNLSVIMKGKNIHSRNGEQSWNIGRRV